MPDINIESREVIEMYEHCGCRSFLTREEKIEMLNDYKEALEKEAKGVTERIKELQKEK